MSKSSSRLLVILEILEQETSENQAINIHDLQAMVEERLEMKIGIKGVRNDLAVLESSEYFPVRGRQLGRALPKEYYLSRRPFKTYEIRLLLDAVSSARFITYQESYEISNKLKMLTSFQEADKLTSILHRVDDKNYSEKIGKKIFTLHEAIQDKCCITFQYGRYKMDKKFHLSRDGKEYEVEPYALFWNQDYYYLIARFPERDDIRHYRVDRMRGVKKQTKKFVHEPTFDLTKYTDAIFHMYSGESPSPIEIEFDQHLINVVIDRFGVNANIQPNESSFVLKTKASINDGLIRWLLTWGGDAKVIWPPRLVQRMKEESAKLYRQYHD